MEKYTVSLKQLVMQHDLCPLHRAKDYDTARIVTADVNRPALQLAGFYEYFDPNRLQFIGRVESKYLEMLSPERRYSALESLMRFDISALILCHEVAIFSEYVELAEKYDRNLLVTDEDTSTFMAEVIRSLRSELAPRTTVHGVLVEVHGEGLLITGDSGVGKSETALELIKRGHRLIADDAVELLRISRNKLKGKAPELIRYYMELRGIGVIDARHTFGVGAVKPDTQVDLVVVFELWDENKVYDRLGIDTQFTHLLGVKLPCVTIPVRPGRNLAVILELAAINNRQKKMGFNAALTLSESHDKLIDSGDGF